MSEIWATRGEWDRVRVCEGVRRAFEECWEDMRACQEFGEASLMVGDEGAGEGMGMGIGGIGSVAGMGIGGMGGVSGMGISSRGGRAYFH